MSTLTLLVSMFAVTTSCLPSPFRSPTAIDVGCESVPNIVGAPNVPLPWLSRTLRLLVPALAVTTSSLPSPLKSPRRMLSGEVPVPVV